MDQITQAQLNALPETDVTHFPFDVPLRLELQAALVLHEPSLLAAHEPVGIKCIFTSNPGNPEGLPHGAP
jgi:hypothetical protein